jgi:oxygen-dependent protoporphyrinogen oxidase
MHVSIDERKERGGAARTAIVVGAGIAGLTAAYRLQHEGWRVIVLERAPQAGGRMSNTTIGSLKVVTGATVLFDFYTDMLALIRHLGLEGRIEWLPEGEAPTIHTADAVFSADAGQGPLQLLRSPALGPASKARLARLVPDVLKARRCTDPNLLGDGGGLDTEPVSSYIRRLVGDDFLENYLEPFFRANWSWEPEEISRAYLLSLLARTGRRLRVFTFDDGVHVLTTELAGRLEVRTGVEVRAVRPREGGGRLVEVHGRDGDETLEADAVAVATTASVARRLVVDLEPWERAFFDSVEYSRVGVVHFVLKDSPDYLEAFYARSHPSPFAIYGQYPGGRKDVGEVPEIYCELTPAAVEDYLAGGGGSLDAFVRPHARSFYPDLDEGTVEVAEQWWDEMLPKFPFGYPTRLKAFLRRQDGLGRPDLVFAGDYLAHSHTGGACASGRVAADTLRARSQRGARR